MLQKVEPWLLPLEETVHNAEYLRSMEATLAYEERQEGTASFWPPDQGELSASQTWWVLDVKWHLVGWKRAW